MIFTGECNTILTPYMLNKKKKDYMAIINIDNYMFDNQILKK